MDEKIKNVQGELREAKYSTEEKSRLCDELQEKVKDLDDKWTKSKRINKQKTEKLEAVEKQMEEAGSSSSVELTQLKTKLKTAEQSLETRAARKEKERREREERH